VSRDRRIGDRIVAEDIEIDDVEALGAVETVDCRTDRSRAIAETLELGAG
jgi:hypothetical protein